MESCFKSFFRDVSITSAPLTSLRQIFSLRYDANCVSTTLTVLILHNVESVISFIVTLYISGSVIKNRVLFVLGLITIFVVGEVGAENHHDYLHTGLILLHVVSICDLRLKNKFTGRNQEHRKEWTASFRYT
jgi:hypothetical protein